MSGNDEKYKGMTYRDLLIHVATLVEDTVEKEIPDLKKENRRIHHRINETHKRINGIKFLTGGLALIGTAIGTFFGQQFRQGG